MSHGQSECYYEIRLRLISYLIVCGVQCCPEGGGFHLFEVCIFVFLPWGGGRHCFEAVLPGALPTSQ